MSCKGKGTTYATEAKDYIAKVLHTYLMQWLQIQIIP